MAIKTILACLTGDTDAVGVIKAACLLARHHDAHLIGLHPVEALVVYPAIAMHIPDAVYAAYGKSQIDQTAALKSLFERHTHAEDFVSEWRLLSCETETAAERIVESARSAEIVVMAAVGGDPTGHRHASLIEAVIRYSGRPVLVVPPDFDGDTLGRSVLIGWNNSREAARAAHDALTLLQAGDIAHILRIADGSHEGGHEDGGDATSNDLAAAFARHEVRTTLVYRTWEKPGVAAALNREAKERDADMIVIGAFGHSRTYDLIIGAATRELIRQSELPVLFSR
jgi:nucleotide-binding universal stress UspA family protein